MRVLRLVGEDVIGRLHLEVHLGVHLPVAMGSLWYIIGLYIYTYAQILIYYVYMCMYDLDIVCGMDMGYVSE
jgi:hypothetical protein